MENNLTNCSDLLLSTCYFGTYYHFTGINLTQNCQHYVIILTRPLSVSRQLKLQNLRKISLIFLAQFCPRLHNFIIDMFFYIYSLTFFFKQLIKHDAVCKCWNFVLVEVIHEIDNVSELLTSTFCESYETRNIGKCQ